MSKRCLAAQPEPVATRPAAFVPPKGRVDRSGDGCAAWRTFVVVRVESPSPPPSTEQRPAGAPAPAEQLQRSRTVAYATGEGRVSRLGRSPTRSAAEGIGLPESPRTV